MTLPSTQLIDIISQVGFPIAAFGMIFWFMVKTQKESSGIINKNTEALIELKTVIREKMK